MGTRISLLLSSGYAVSRTSFFKNLGSDAESTAFFHVNAATQNKNADIAGN